MALQLMTNTHSGKISGSTASTIHTPDLRIYVYSTQHTEVRILLHYFNLLYDKPIGPAALTLMDRQTCVSSAHGQTDSQCIVIVCKGRINIRVRVRVRVRVIIVCTAPRGSRI